MKKAFRLRILAVLEALLLTGSAFCLPVSCIEDATETEISDSAELSDASSVVPPDSIQKSGNAQIEAFLTAAVGEVGYVQENGISKYGTWFAPGYDYAAWCAIFVAWCGDQAGIPTSVIARMATTDGGWYAEHGTVHYFFEPWINCYNQNIIVSRGIKCSRTEYTPQRGDLIYFKWTGTPTTSTFSHVGIVYGAADGYVYTVEGNSGSPGSVRYKRYSQTDSQILCYATPDYSTDSVYKTGIFTTGIETPLLSDAHENAVSLLQIPVSSALTVTEILGVYGKAEWNGKTGWVLLSNTARTADISVSSVELDPILKLTAGTVSVLHSGVTPAYATFPALSYYSSDTTVATVTPQGGIVAISEGAATITAVTEEGIGAVCSIEVLPSTGTDCLSGWMTLLPPVPEDCERTVETKVLYSKAQATDALTDTTVSVSSDWSDTKTTREKPVESVTLRITGTATAYVYYHYHNVYESGISGIDSIPIGASAEYDEITLDRQLPLSGMHDMGGQQPYYDENYDCTLKYRSWFLKETYPVYTYQTCEKTEMKISVSAVAWSEWSDTRPTPAAGEILRQITVYRSYDRKVTSVKINSLPSKTVFSAHEDADFSGLTILVGYSDKTTRVISGGFSVTDYDADTEGQQTVTVTYFGQSAAFQITVSDPNAAKIGGTKISGVWKETLTLDIPITDNHGLLAYTMYLDCDSSALSLGIPVTSVPGTFSYTTGGAHTLTVTFSAESPLTGDLTLFSLPVTILRTAETGKAYPVTLSYDASATLSDVENPICLVPSDSMVQVNREAGHALTVIEEQAPTCTADGWQKSVCSICDETMTTILPAAGHTYRDTVTQPTETAEGFTTHTCTVCGSTYIDTKIPSLGFAVTFLNDDGSVFKLLRVQSGSEITLPTDVPVKASDTNYNYTFTGWEGFVSGMKAAKTISFRAQFAKTPQYPSSVSTSVYKIENGTVIRKIPLSTAASTLIAGTGEKEYLRVIGANGVAVTSAVGSGMSLQLICGGNTVQTLTVVVTGDPSGDGKLSVTDFVLLRSHLLGKTSLTGASLAAADLNGDGNVSVTDYVLMKSALLGKTTVTPH